MERILLALCLSLSLGNALGITSSPLATGDFLDAPSWEEQGNTENVSVFLVNHSLQHSEAFFLDEGYPSRLISPLLTIASRGAPPIRLAANGEATGIAVIYPDIGEPYRSLFAKIIEGIEGRVQTKVSSYAVGNNFNPQELSNELKKQDIRIVIALGRNGLKAANALHREISVVASGIISVPENDTRSASILSLAPDPALLFKRLRILSPATRRVLVVFDPRQSAWLIRLAKEAAKQQNIELVAQEASDLKTALLHYQEFFAQADGRRDAVWLPQDNVTVDESTVLPLVLQESWSKAVPVFSSNVAHVKRGVLFSLYPNNLELGRSIAASAIDLGAGNNPPRTVLPLRSLFTALNVRTASHLGINQTIATQDVDLIFPEY